MDSASGEKKQKVEQEEKANLAAGEVNCLGKQIFPHQHACQKYNQFFCSVHGERIAVRLTEK